MFYDRYAFYLHNLRTSYIIRHPHFSTLNVPDEIYLNPETQRQDDVHQINIHVIPYAGEIKK
jgi:hypothetical protein